tara:strand:+ start:7999 stop:8334 length:336 start_codon:yes stop_codon:yes gene_type:complete
MQKDIQFICREYREWQPLIAAFDNRFDRIICADLSRISRDQADTTELKAWFEDNTEQMRLRRLDIDREKRPLADLSPPPIFGKSIRVSPKTSKNCGSGAAIPRLSPSYAIR